MGHLLSPEHPPPVPTLCLLEVEMDPLPPLALTNCRHYLGCDGHIHPISSLSPSLSALLVGHTAVSGHKMATIGRLWVLMWGSDEDWTWVTDPGQETPFVSTEFHSEY